MNLSFVCLLPTPGRVSKTEQVVLKAEAEVRVFQGSTAQSNGNSSACARFRSKAVTGK